MTLPSTVVLDGGWSTTREAEHAVRESLAVVEVRPRLACTHFVDRRVVVTLETGSTLPLPEEVEPAALGVLAWAVGAHRARAGGRVFLFEGEDSLPERLTVEQLVATTPIEDVRGIGFTVDPATDLLTQGFVRPRFEGGRMVLPVRPAADDVVVPFEQRDPTPCCADR